MRNVLLACILLVMFCIALCMICLPCAMIWYRQVVVGGLILGVEGVAATGLLSMANRAESARRCIRRAIRSKSNGY